MQLSGSVFFKLLEVHSVMTLHPLDMSTYIQHLCYHLAKQNYAGSVFSY